MERMPQVRYNLVPENMNASCPAIVPATILDGSGRWEGKLILTNLNHVIDPDWVAWSGATDVLCTIGQKDPAFAVARKFRVKGVAYWYWAPGYQPTIDTYQRVFGPLAHKLRNGATMIIHCKSGRDRGAFTTAAFFDLPVQHVS